MGGDTVRGRRRSLAAIVLVVAATSAIAGPGGPDRVEAAPTELFDGTPRPLGAVSVIGDSVLLGGLIVSPTIVDRLGAHGWGPIRARAGEGYRTGHVASAPTSKASYWIERWRAEGWDAPNVLVNLGANDLGFCRADDPECSYLAVMHLVEAIGPGHRIWWPKVTRPASLAVPQANWNAALDRVAAERDDVVTWDWPAVMAAGPFPSPDATHLTGEGYRLRSALMAEQFTIDLARATRSGAAADLPSAAGPATEIVPVGPARLLDTREHPPRRLDADATIEIAIDENVPASAVAVAAYVTAVDAGDRGYLTVWDCDTDRPIASTVNYEAGGTRGSVGIVGLSESRTICVFSRADADVVVDVQAAFVPAGASGARFDPIDRPTRLLDTRDTGRAELLEIPLDASAELAVVSLAAIGRGARGFATAYDCSSERPPTASVNHGAFEVVNSLAFVPIDDDGAICVFVKSGADITVDLAGTMSRDGALVFVPAAPTRTIDTRNSTGGWSPLHGSSQTIDATVAPADAEAVSGTLTIVEPMRTGHLRAWGCGALPDTANVNAAAGSVLANAVTTGLGDGGRLCVFARTATGTVFDTTGWWVRPG